MPRFAEIARMTGVPLEQVALAIAGELHPVNFPAGAARLDLIADQIGDLSELPPAERAGILVNHLERTLRLRTRIDRDPEALMLDRVIEERSGHPYALAIIYAAIGSRCGMETFPVLCGRALLVGDRVEGSTILIDPVQGGRAMRHRPSWVCPHVVARILLGAIGERYEERGDIERAIRTTELADLLPLHGGYRGDDEIVRRNLQANFN